MIIRKEARVVVQGADSDEAKLWAKMMLDYGTNIVGGVGAGRQLCKLPMFKRVREAQADASVVFTPGPEAAADVQQAVDAGIGVIVILTEGMPIQDFIQIEKAKATIIGPGSPGFINVGENMLGKIPYEYFRWGNVGIISRSSTLMYEAADILSSSGLGVSSAVGLGSDQMLGSDYFSFIRYFEEDPKTKAVLLIGEVGGSREERLAQLMSNLSKPAFSYIVGRHAPPARTMGHAGAFIFRGHGAYQSKIEALSKISTIVPDLYKLPDLIKEKMSSTGSIMEKL